jgi:mevalonate kinase
MGKTTRLLEVPTKVMLAGEYGILQPEGLALAVATSPGFLVSASAAANWHVVLPDLETDAQAGSVAELGGAHAMDLIREALCEAQRHWPALPPMSLTFTGHRHRLPVGASAALVVGTLLAARAVMGVRTPVRALLESSIRAHRAAQGNGSGYDVATVLLGGTVLCHRDARGQLTARGIRLAGGRRVVAAEVGERSATGQAIGRVMSSTGVAGAMDDHRRTSRALITTLMKPSSQDMLQSAVIAANATLARLDELSGGRILTPPVQGALLAGAPFPVRVSGAGGGDLVVGFVDSLADAEHLVRQWQEAGFRARQLVY